MPITPTPGAVALAFGFTLVNGASDLRSDVDELINRALDQVVTLVAKNIRAIEFGGTGGSTPATARTALGLKSAALSESGDFIGAGGSDVGVLALAHGGGRVQVFGGGNFRGYVAYTSDVDGKANKGGDTFTGDIYIPNAYPVSSGYTSLYRDGSGRIGLAPSGEQFKYRIKLIHPDELGDLETGLYEFVMRGDRGRMKRVGSIAQRLDEHPASRRFVIYDRDQVLDDEGNATGEHHLKLDADGNPIPISIDFTSLHIAQIAQLYQRDRERASELDALRARVAEQDLLIEAMLEKLDRLTAPGSPPQDPPTPPAAPAAADEGDDL